MYTLYAPNDFCFKSALEKKLHTPLFIKRNLWKYHHVFSLVLDKIEARGGDSAFVPLNIGELDKELGNSELHGKSFRFSTMIIDDMVAWGIVLREWHNKNKPGDLGIIYSTSTRVKIKEEVLLGGYDEWEVPATVKPSPLTSFNSQYKPLTGIYKRLEDNLSIIEFDVAGARAYAEYAYATRMPLRDKRRRNILLRDRSVNYRVFQHWMRAIDDMERRNYRASSDEHKTGRFFSLLSNLPNQLRQFITINGQPLAEVDIASSQCLIFAIYLKQKYGAAFPIDVANYINLCEAGQFYPCIKPLMLGYEEDMDGNLFKTTFFGRVFFSSEKVNYKWRVRFATYFPTVSAEITNFKSISYKNLPEKLSHLESEIMLHRITPRLFAQGITTHFSVHDSFFCTPDVRDAIETILMEEFGKYGVTPFVKDKTGTGGTIKLTAAPPPQEPAVVAANILVPVATPDYEAMLAVLEAEFELLEAKETDTLPLVEHEQLEVVSARTEDHFWVD